MIEDVEYEVFLLNKHATEGRKKYLEAKKWANKPREQDAEVFLSNPNYSRFHLIKKLIEFLNLLKIKIVCFIFENYMERNDFLIFCD